MCKIGLDGFLLLLLSRHFSSRPSGYELAINMVGKIYNFFCYRTSYFRSINGVCYFRMAAFFITVYFRRIYRVRTYVTSAYIYTNTKGNGGKSSWYTANRKCNWNINGATSRWSYC